MAKKKNETVKEIASVEEALRLLVVGRICSRKEVYRCETCPVREYERYKGGNCIGVRDRAVDFLYDKGLLPIEENFDFSKCSTKDQPQISPKDRKCANCQHKKLLEGGYLFCNKFHNTTIPEGYCHNFEEVSDLE